MTIVGEILRKIVGVGAVLLAVFRKQAESTWNELTDDLKANSLSGAKFADILKASLNKTYAEFSAEAISSLGVSGTTVESLLIEAAKATGVVIEGGAEDVFNKVKEKISSITVDSFWDSTFQTIMKFATTFISSGVLDWKMLSFGLAEIAYEKYQESKK